jgi:hypothetical protein
MSTSVLLVLPRSDAERSSHSSRLLHICALCVYMVAAPRRRRDHSPWMRLEGTSRRNLREMRQMYTEIASY